MCISPALEIVSNDHPAGPFKLALFDFDGTLSLLRRNWQETMSGLLLEILQATGTSDAQPLLEAVVHQIVVGLNGWPTILQMQALAKEVTRLGGTPQAPDSYKDRYLGILGELVNARTAALASGAALPAEHLVQGAEQMLSSLAERGCLLCLASGTDYAAVRGELKLLQLQSWFDERVFAPGPHDPEFSKGRVIAQLLTQHQLAPEQLVSFGDGVVETSEVRKIGGLAIGVASDETLGRGVNPLKREQLIAAGADWIIGDYLRWQELAVRLC